jgi:hypothetical protein
MISTHLLLETLIDLPCEVPHGQRENDCGAHPRDPPQHELTAGVPLGTRVAAGVIDDRRRQLVQPVEPFGLHDRERRRPRRRAARAAFAAPYRHRASAGCCSAVRNGTSQLIVVRW